MPEGAGFGRRSFWVAQRFSAAITTLLWMRLQPLRRRFLLQDGSRILTIGGDSVRDRSTGTIHPLSLETVSIHPHMFFPKTGKTRTTFA